MKRGFYVLYSALVFCLLLSFASGIYTQNLPAQAATSKGVQFVVQTLKYDPYPINAGDWFDLWVKVQNIGGTVAPYTKFQLVPDYPFSSNSTLTASFGHIGGTSDTGEVVLKYRVKVDESAPAGTSTLNLGISTDYNGDQVLYPLQIDIAKTKADFDLMLQDITPEGTSFVITNIADNAAHSVVLTIKSDNIFNLGSRSVVIGDLDKGDFTIAHIKSIPQSDAKTMDLEVSYTDDSGTRNTVEKTIQIETPAKIDQICINNSGSYVKWIWGVVGLFLGVLLILALISIDKKIMRRNNEKRTTSHSTVRKN